MLGGHPNPFPLTSYTWRALQSISLPSQPLPGSADIPIHPHTLPGLQDTPIHPHTLQALSWLRGHPNPSLHPPSTFLSWRMPQPISVPSHTWRTPQIHLPTLPAPCWLGGCSNPSLHPPTLGGHPKSIFLPSQPLAGLEDAPIHPCIPPSPFLAWRTPHPTLSPRPCPVPCDAVLESPIPVLSAAAASRSSRLPCSSSGLRGGGLRAGTGDSGCGGGHPGVGPYLGMWQGDRAAAGMRSRSVMCMKGRWK